MAINPGLENPIDVFTPILQQALQDAQSLLTQESNDPFPIVRAALLDLTSVFGLISPVPQPFVGVGNAFNTTTAGQPLAGGGLGLPTDPLGGIGSTAQGFLQRQLTVASQLLTAVPTAAIGVMVSTFNAFVQTTLAVLRAGVGVVSAVVTLNPVQVINSVIDGTALVANVVEQTTIGQPQFDKIAAADVATAPSIGTISRIPSILGSINNGRRLIANALSPQRALAAQAAVTGAQFAVPNTTGTPAASSTTAAAPAAQPAASSTTAAAPAAQPAASSTTAAAPAAQPAASSTTAAAPAAKPGASSTTAAGPAAKVAATKAAASSTTEAPHAGKVAKKPTRTNAEADEVKSSVTTVQKEAGGASSSTAAAK
jgi:hypothetical protein